MPGAEVHRRDGERQVSQVMRAATEVLRSEMTVREAFERAHKTEFRSWPVADERGLVGIVDLTRLEQAMAHGEETKQLSDLVDVLDFPHVHPDQPLHLALERMGAAELDVLPVVNQANLNHLMGVVGFVRCPQLVMGLNVANETDFGLWQYREHLDCKGSTCNEEGRSCVRMNWFAGVIGFRSYPERRP